MRAPLPEVSQAEAETETYWGRRKACCSEWRSRLRAQFPWREIERVCSDAPAHEGWRPEDSDPGNPEGPKGVGSQWALRGWGGGWDLKGPGRGPGLRPSDQDQCRRGSAGPEHTAPPSPGLMAVRASFENNCEIGCFAKLTNTYCLVAIGGSENFYRCGASPGACWQCGWVAGRGAGCRGHRQSEGSGPVTAETMFLQCVRGRARRDHPCGARVHCRLPHHRAYVCG